MQIKTYTLREGDDLRSVTASGANHVILDFRPTSAYCPTMISTHAGIIPDRSGNEMAACGEGAIVRIGMFADEMPQNIITRVVNYQLDVVLLTGNESPTLIRNLRRTLDPTALEPGTVREGTIRRGIQFWKQVDAGQAANLPLCGDYCHCVDALILDVADGDSVDGVNVYVQFGDFLLRF